MRRQRMVSVLLVAPLIFMSACGGDKPEKKLPPIKTASPTASATPDALPTTREEAKTLHLSVLGKSAANSDDERDVVEAWMTYWQATADTYFDLKPSPKLNVAKGDAVIGVLNLLAKLKAKDERIVGWARDNVTNVRVSGDAASVRDCTENFTFSINAKDKPIDEPTPFYESTGEFKKEGGKWIVTDFTSKDATTSCLK